MAFSIVPAGLCKNRFYLLLCVGNLVPEDLSKSFAEHATATSRDRVLIEWLRARQSQPRCGFLLQQICEWKTKDDRRTIRNLAKAQGIVVSPRTTEVVLEEVRKHFRDAVAQDKGRLATFVFQTSRRPSELPMQSTRNEIRSKTKRCHETHMLLFPFILQPDYTANVTCSKAPTGKARCK